MNVASMHILFFYIKIWYTCLSALKCIWQEHYFQNMLCWLLPGVIQYLGVNFFFPNAGISHGKWQKANMLSLQHLCAIQPYNSYCNVWNEVTPSGKCPSDDSENFQSLIHAYFDLLCDSFFLRLWHASSLSTQRGS